MKIYRGGWRFTMTCSSEEDANRLMDDMIEKNADTLFRDYRYRAVLVRTDGEYESWRIDTLIPKKRWYDS